MSDTIIQIKRSSSNTTPNTLTEGELAYSYVSNVLFIGDTANAAINIGGLYYTDLLDNATASNASSNFVKRYANGSAQFSQLDILNLPTSNTQVATKKYVDDAVLSNVTLASLNDVNIGAEFSDQNNKILIGNSAGYYVGTSLSGNISITNTGIVTIGNAQVVGSMLANTLVGSKTFANNLTIGETLHAVSNVQITKDLRVTQNIAFTNATNSVMAYTYYNVMADSIDTVFV